MNTSALRKSLHKVANYDRNVGDVLGELHKLMLDMDGSTKSCQQVCTRSQKEHERANLLDDIADRGTDEQVVLWAKVRIPTIPPSCSEGRRPVFPKESAL